jgi:hypothetical protein
MQLLQGFAPGHPGAFEGRRDRDRSDRSAAVDDHLLPVWKHPVGFLNQLLGIARGAGVRRGP